MNFRLRVESFRNELSDWSLALSQPLLRNRSITNLAVGVSDYGEGTAPLGKAVARSKTIRKIRLLPYRLGTSNTFVSLRFFDSLCVNISENCALCCACLEWEVPCLPWGCDSLVIVRDTVHRNLSYVARAAQFSNQARSDILCAAALDRVYRQPALIAELSKVLAVSEADAVVAVRQGYRSIEGMHDWTPWNEQCWAHVRWYLQLDDVAWPCRSSTNVL
ncbi:hypothetical protein MRX96_011812 [Rhipicephalus microplus]